MKKITIIGAGAWGTALANIAAVNGHDTLIWALETDCAEAINTQHVNLNYLPDAPLDPRLRATNALADIKGSDAVLVVVPAQFMRASLKNLAPLIAKDTPVILCSKGIEIGSLDLMTDVLAQEIPHAVPAVLSGPSFAIDVAKGLPTAVTLACTDETIAAELAEMLGSRTFRPYTSNDLIGAEIGGSVKNVLAIACGICLGLGLGRSAHAALIARGFAEMTRLGTALGADVTTLTGLCGLGDLVLTCSSEQSRNMSFGMALGKGQSAEEILASRKAVTEGVPTSHAILALSQKMGIDMPICETVSRILSGEMDTREALDTLLGRPLRAEVAL